jgi:hypothetical protein
MTKNPLESWDKSPREKLELVIGNDFTVKNVQKLNLLKNLQETRTLITIGSK